MATQTNTGGFGPGTYSPFDPNAEDLVSQQIQTGLQGGSTNPYASPGGSPTSTAPFAGTAPLPPQPSSSGIRPGTYGPYDPNPYASPGGSPTSTAPFAGTAPLPPQPSSTTSPASVPISGSPWTNPMGTGTPTGLVNDGPTRSWVQQPEEGMWGPPSGVTPTAPGSSSSSTSSGTAPTGGNPTDPTYVAAAVKWLSQQPGADPTLASDPNYWAQKIISTGGWDGAGNTGYWTTRSKAGAGNTSGVSAGGGSGSGGSGLGGPGAVSPISYSPYNANPMVSDAIQRLLKQGQSPVSASDPNIAGATAAYKAQADTATRGSRAALAERDAQEGLNSGGAGSGSFDSAIQAQQEQEGRDVGSFSSNLVIQEIQARRQDVLNALQSAQGEEKNALALQLAQMNDALQRAGAGQQNQQFYDSLSSGMSNSSNSLNNQLLGSLLQNG